jgi:hypothetical protein
MYASNHGSFLQSRDENRARTFVDANAFSPLKPNADSGGKSGRFLPAHRPISRPYFHPKKIRRVTTSSSCYETFTKKFEVPPRRHNDNVNPVRRGERPERRTQYSLK